MKETPQALSYFCPGWAVESLLKKGTCSGGVVPRVTILAEWFRHFNDLAVGETAASACFSRENAEGAGMPPLLSR